MADVGFQTPESILYVPDEDIYLVSNINGGPTDADDNGFISRVSPEGKVLELKWIDGTKKEVTLDAPKGMAIAGDVLYVSDIKWVRAFDKKTGKQLGKVGVGGATFLNDLSSAPDGKSVWLSDSGIKFGAQGPEQTKSDGIFQVSNMKAKLVAKATELNGPNGVLADESGTWVVSYLSNELYYIGSDGKKDKIQALPAKSLDGIAQAADGSVLISSWDSKAVLQGTPAGEFVEVVSGVESPADIGYDSKRNRVLIPLFMKNRLEFHTLAGALPPAAAPATAAAPAAAPAAAAPAPAATAAPAPAGGAAAPKPAAAAPAPAASKPAAPAPAPAKPAAAPAK
jgi:sugar lactone lactonase YvrE